MNVIHRVTLIALVFAASLAFAQNQRDITGAVHWNNYTFSSTDSLNAGAARVRGMGARVVKVLFNNNTSTTYTHNSIWPINTPFSLVQLAKTKHFTDLFAKDFHIFVLVVEGGDTVFCCDGMTTAEKAAERARIEELAYYLFSTYKGTGKTFVIQNWEGDNQMYMNGTLVNGEPSQANIQGMIDWMNARQDGVNAARARAQADGLYNKVWVWHAAEVNWVTQARTQPSKISMTNNVLPYTYCDLYSYSVWDVNSDVNVLYNNLEHLRLKAPASPRFGDQNIVIGEYSGGDSSLPMAEQTSRTRRLLDLISGYGVRYSTYWQLFESTATTLLTPSNSENGHATELKNTLNRTLHRYALRTPSGTYVSAESAGGPNAGPGYVYANAPHVKEWEYLTIVDKNGGTLVSGDVINILTHRGYYIKAIDNGGGDVAADAPHALSWEEFTVLKLNGTGAIVEGDSIAIRTSDGIHYLGATNAGGPGSYLVAWGTSVGTWEPFIVSKWQY